MNPSSREIYVVGVFDCGCNYESSFGSVDIVRCYNQKQLGDVKKKMNKHSCDYQCNFRHALCLLVFEGKLKFKFKGYPVHSYKAFLKLWLSRNKDGKKMTREMNSYNKKFERICAWEERRRKYQEKITLQEDVNTGCGLS
jgi:hypothetical protein